MNNFVVRSIKEDADVKQALKMWLDHPKVMGTRIERSEYGFHIWLRGNSWSKSYVMGAFDNDTLIGMMRYNMWNNIPYYSFDGLHTKKGSFITYNYKNGNHPFVPLMNHIMKKMEEQERYTWFYHRAIRPGYGRLTDQQDDLLRYCDLGWDKEKNHYRYDRYVDEIVPAGERTPTIAFNTMLFNRPYKFDIMVVKCCLKPEYRRWGDVFKVESEYKGLDNV